ncbi:MAG TPA: helix-turn-helix domain-containing protein [Isosphaeraceae bacterium]|nr:helix-turn-helix domain-containing protein [Isosphaeraceae bacterium]
MSGLRLTAAQRRRLEPQLRTTRDAGLYRRTLAILEAADGRPIAELARLLRASRRSVHSWVESFEDARDRTCPADHRGGNRPSLWAEELRAALLASLERRPDQFGYQAVEWPAPLLREHLARRAGQRPSATSIRRQLHDSGYVWKRPRSVLDPDPERDKKTADSPGDPRPAAPVGHAVRG